MGHQSLRRMRPGRRLAHARLWPPGPQSRTRPFHPCDRSSTLRLVEGLREEGRRSVKHMSGLCTDRCLVRAGLGPREPPSHTVRPTPTVRRHRLVEGRRKKDGRRVSTGLDVCPCQRLAHTRRRPQGSPSCPVRPTLTVQSHCSCRGTTEGGWLTGEHRPVVRSGRLPARARRWPEGSPP